MATEITVVRGAVIVTGDLTADAAETLARRHSRRTRVDIWRARLANLDALTPLQHLDELTLANCTIDDASALAGLPTLRSLTLNQVRSTHGWGFLAELTPLETLNLRNLRGDVELPDLAPLASLTQLELWGCTGITDASSLLGLPALTELSVVDTGLDLESLRPVVALPSVRYASAQFRTNAANAAFEALLDELGKRRHPDPT